MSPAPLLLLLAGLAAQDPVRVQAGLTRADIRVGETTVLRVDAETDGPRAQIERLVRLPPGVELVSTRDYDQRQFSIPGGTRRFVSREFVLRARAEGRYRIPALGVTVDGRSYSTSSQLLTVTAPPPGLRPGSGGDGAAGEVTLTAWLDADTAYVGEQVTMQAEAMFSQTARLRLRRAPEYQAPSPSGFWIHDLPDRRTSGTRVIDNRVYEVQGFRRAFFPLSPGLHVVEPARLEYEMRRGILYAPETFEVLSDSMRLVVLSLPEEDRPAGFTGAVGRYSVTGSIEPAQVPAGEAAVLTIDVTGAGNVKALPPPQLPELPTVEVFPPSEEAETEITDGVVAGRKSFSWVIIPREAGTLEIPPIRYPYFDPQDGRFETTAVEAMTLRVTPGVVAEGTASTADALRYLKTAPSGADPLRWARSPWFALAQLLPLLALAAGLFAGRTGGGISRRDLRRRRRAGVRDLEQRAAAGDPSFLAQAESFVRGWIADRLGIRPADAGRTAALTGAGLRDGTATAVARLLDRIAAARYAPGPPSEGTRRSIVEQLEAAVRRVDREAPAPRRGAGSDGPARGGGGFARGALGISILLAWAVPSPAFATLEQDAAGRDSAFATGLALFDAGRFDAAAEAFDRHVDVHPDDAAGWYNLGTAYQHAGHTGYAVWAWLHVLRLDPRDEDTRHNLRVADVPTALVRQVSPPLPLRPVELALAASLAWLVAGVAGGWFLARRGRRQGVVAASALVLAIGLGGLWLGSTRSAETLIVLESATLRAGPALGGEPLEELSPGDGLMPVATYGEWLRVRTLNGREGWIENRSAGAV